MSITRNSKSLAEKTHNISSLTPIAKWRLATSSKDLDVLAILAEDEDSEVAEAVGLNSCTPPDVLDSIARRVTVWCKIAAAKHPNTSLETLAYLSTAVEPTVRKEIALNPNCPAALLNTLAHEEEDSIRSCVISNPNVSEETLLMLTKDPRSYIRSDILLAAQNKLKIIVVLLDDEYLSVQENAKGLITRMDDKLLVSQAYALWGELVNSLPASYIRKLILIGQLRWGV